MTAKRAAKKKSAPNPEPSTALPTSFQPDPPAGVASWRSRIVRRGHDSPDNLLANPANHRIHSAQQQAAMQSVLDTIGWVGDVIVNERTGHMIDGHMRVRIAMRRDEPTIPVTYVDLSLDEEKVILLTFDRVGAMAGLDTEKTRDLASDVRAFVATVPTLDLLIASMVDSGAGHAIVGDQSPAAGHLSFGGAASRFDADDWIIWDAQNQPLVTVRSDGVVVMKPRISRPELQIIFRDIARRMRELESAQSVPPSTKARP